MSIFAEDHSIEPTERNFTLVLNRTGEEKNCEKQYWRLRDEHLPNATVTAEARFKIDGDCVLRTWHITDCVMFNALICLPSLSWIEAYGLSPTVFAPVYAATGPSWPRHPQSRWYGISSLIHLTLCFDVGTIHGNVDLSVNDLARMTREIASNGIYSLLINLKKLQRLQIEFFIPGGFKNELPARFKNVVPFLRPNALNSLKLAGFSDDGSIPLCLSQNQETLKNLKLSNIYFEAPVSTLMDAIENLNLTSVEIDGKWLTKDDGGKALEIHFENGMKEKIHNALKEGKGKWREVLVAAGSWSK